jgi:hypothetical protein
MITWKPIPGYETLYEVSDAGAIKTLRSGRILRPQLSNRGYMRVMLYGPGGRVGWRSVHRLVAEAFLANPFHLPIVRHLDDDKQNNLLENLAWGTYVDNTADSIALGNHPAATVLEACVHGHVYQPGSFTMRRNGNGYEYRSCLECERQRSAASYQKYIEKRRRAAQERRDLSRT